MKDRQNLFIFESSNVIVKVWKVIVMMTKTIVNLLMMSLLAMAALPMGAGQVGVAIPSESNATMAIANNASIEPEEELFPTMEILGPWKVEFNSTEKLSSEEFHFDEENSEDFFGMSIEGMEMWAMALIDSMDHEIAFLWIMDLDRASTTNDEMLDELMDSTLSGFEVDTSIKSTVEIDGNRARRAVGFSSMYNRNIQAFAYSYEPYFDSFYNQNVSKSFIYGIDFREAKEDNDLIESLHVERMY